MILPTKKEFLKKAERYNLIPLYMEVMADMETPISIFQKVRREGPSYFLESGEVGEKFGRYSFIGLDSFIYFESREGKVRVTGSRGEEKTFTGNPLKVLRSVMKDFKPAEDPDLPRFYGGAVGFAGYDIVSHLENISLPQEDDLELPEASFIFARLVLIYDHWRHTLKIVVNVWVRENPEKEYERACQEIKRVLKDLKGPLPETFEGEKYQEEITFKSNFVREDFKNKVMKAKDYIGKGDIFQLVLSQRFEAPLTVHPLNLYRVLRTVNPSPYMYYLDFGEYKIVGSSPEPLVKLEGGVVETRPIAGTRPRGNTAEEDLRMARDLLQDEKEKAEHIMLVDLARNDLGRICEYGTVETKNLFSVEKYSHVMHMVTEVKGVLRKDRDALDVLMASFPAGTVSGAPKIRAMEIISELEPARRGPYAGAVGYFGFSGNMDTCITIRTMVIKEDRVYVQAGAGIVADSQPEKEYQETQHKAAALLKALNKAREGYYDFSYR
ncbi:MAG: anthranilate synthase component I [Candidatus Syntrophonatronum acetioxidans]|uniref:Anthranilate synthase component 1 n=1 Tax=Candidatus Syntrophonatronum acetioxidans TaxID=1795816 RepID=A0A424YHH2_9FIRM|nr:MAG: anthranilate synthase component I [Candidatus Syntrophonatronum acetioxidans]